MQMELCLNEKNLKMLNYLDLIQGNHFLPPEDLPSKEMRIKDRDMRTRLQLRITAIIMFIGYANYSRRSALWMELENFVIRSMLIQVNA